MWRLGALPGSMPLRTAWGSQGMPGRAILASREGGNADLLGVRLPDWEAWDPGSMPSGVQRVGFRSGEPVIQDAGPASKCES